MEESSSGDFRGEGMHQRHSKPIPISRRRPTVRAHGDDSSTGHLAKSAPVPVAPVIYSLKAPSNLDKHMPTLELPPRYFDKERSGNSNHSKFASSVPFGDFTFGTKKPVLHAIDFRQRSRRSQSFAADCPSSSHFVNDNTPYPIFEADCEDEASSISREDDLSSMEVFNTIKAINSMDDRGALSKERFRDLGEINVAGDPKNKISFQDGILDPSKFEAYEPQDNLLNNETNETANEFEEQFDMDNEM